MRLKALLQKIAERKVTATFDGIIADNIEPAKIVSGWEALNIYTNCDFIYGKQEISPADEM